MVACSQNEATKLNNLLSKFFALGRLRLQPITIRPALRDFLAMIDDGYDANELEQTEPDLLAECQRIGVVKLDPGSYQDDGFYVVTRLGRASLAAPDRMAPWRQR